MPLILPPRDIAEAIVFRIRSDFIIGHVIDVDGGRHLQGCPADLKPSPVHHAR
jgi:NAD(P)-dependent dehydrogenase (short-subunit alcohol dehydrogenase family)